MSTTEEHPTVYAPVASLTPHPRNYRGHPDDQIEHLKASILEHGFYRNIVVARDDTILAGHGVVKAAMALGYEQVPVIRLDIDPDSPAALKVLTGDNEMGRLADIDDRVLSELLRGLHNDDDLLGTGYDDKMLANLLFVTRDSSEIRDFNAAAEWVGMPDYDGTEKPFKLIVSFETTTDRDRLIAEADIHIRRKHPDNPTWSGVWPSRPRDDLVNVRVVG